MKKLYALLAFLISSLAITGISFLDGKIWNIIFLIVGMLAYALVGVLLSLGILSGKEASKDAYVFFFALLLIAGYGVYKALRILREWMLNWPLVVKIIVPIVLLLSVVALCIFIVVKRKKEDADKF